MTQAEPTAARHDVRDVQRVDCCIGGGGPALVRLPFVGDLLARLVAFGVWPARVET